MERYCSGAAERVQRIPAGLTRRRLLAEDSAGAYFRGGALSPEGRETVILGIGAGRHERGYLEYGVCIRGD
ncbi:hypothetical protein [Segniliparus rugosus]|uniref:Uncharacterized protein n=1 Tax=Segniliparus rugosus (strain ATCC BAA-974 / DSM 45345 / CCUG 50838 / CIP 108380 / JCM 13579 / CDC 945) TaxID=679197 RepID=E5XUI7_SEGRC|nr:hypothetical protein [Segniliparus rugosus]EFV11966.1 hypothetical protein HMPREF9336_03159 [Segniliparus rugosus ATCC BAA-974]